MAEYVRKLKVEKGLKPPVKVKRRFETRPGQEMQLDWSPYTVYIAGVPTKIHVLGVILAHSRKLHYRAYRNERQSTLLEAMAIAGEDFGGFTLELVLDNMATAILGRTGRDGKVIWNPRFLEFCKHYGFKPVACRPRDPDRKGKKEKSFRLLFEDFLKGTEFISWEDFQYRLKIWLNDTVGVANLRKHGTTGLIPNEAYLAERPLLIPLPSERFPVAEDKVCVVDADATISVDGIRYTIPEQFVSKKVPIRKYAEHFEVIDTNGNIAYSRRYIDRTIRKEKLVIDETCYSRQPKRPGSPGSCQHLDEAFVLRFPSLAPFVEGLKMNFKGLAYIHIRKLIRLCGTYGEEAFIDVVSQLQECRRFKTHSVARLLEKKYPMPPEVLDMPLGGKGALLLGEVEEVSLDEGYGELDTRPTTVKEEEEIDGEG